MNEAQLRRTLELVKGTDWRIRCHTCQSYCLKPEHITEVGSNAYWICNDCHIKRMAKLNEVTADMLFGKGLAHSYTLDDLVDDIKGGMNGRYVR